MVGTPLLEQQRRGSGPQWENDQAAEPEREGDGRAPREDVVGTGLQQVRREGVSDRQDVTMTMHTAFGLTGRARSERDEADVIRGRRHRSEAGGLGAGETGQVAL